MCNWINRFVKNTDSFRKQNTEAFFQPIPSKTLIYSAKLQVDCMSELVIKLPNWFLKTQFTQERNKQVIESFFQPIPLKSLIRSRTKCHYCVAQRNTAVLLWLCLEPFWLTEQKCRFLNKFKLLIKLVYWIVAGMIFHAKHWRYSGQCALTAWLLLNCKYALIWEF